MKIENLQSDFGFLVNQRLINQNLRIRYFNINFLNFWNVINSDREFKDYINKTSNQYLRNAYKLISNDSRIFEKAREYCVTIIKNYIENQRLNDKTVNWYVNFAVCLTIIITEFLQFNSHRPIRPSIIGDLIEEKMESFSRLNYTNPKNATTVLLNFSLYDLRDELWEYIKITPIITFNTNI